MTDRHPASRINDLDPEQLARWFQTQGQPVYRARQVCRWLYRHQADSFDVMTNLSKQLRSMLKSHFRIERLKIGKIETAADGTEKYRFRLHDGHVIESVLIPEKDHDTLCISSQVGCAQGCRFCMTAAGGFHRNLSAGEIVSQVRDIMARHAARPLTNIVMMGMGEPLANYDAVCRAIRMITDADWGLGISARRFTLSTAGLVPRMADLGRDTDINLAVSLNASTDPVRSRLMPINRAYPLDVLIDACSRYTMKPRQRITFEYILIRGINDTLDDARRLARLLKPVRCKVNLIPFNEHPRSEFRRPDQHVIDAFQQILQQHHYTAIVRYSKGQDISAACGQLAGED